MESGVTFALCTLLTEEEQQDPPEIPCLNVGHGRKDKGFMMRFRKTADGKRDTYTYTDCNGKMITIHEGDYDLTDHRRVTKEHIKELHKKDDREVENNLRNCRRKLTDGEKQQIREWEEEHPGEEAPTRYHASLEYEMKDHNMNQKNYASEILNMRQEVNYEVERLYEVLEDIDEKDRYCLIEVKLKGFSMKEVAERLGIEPSTVYRNIKRAINYIRDHYYDEQD